MCFFPISPASFKYLRDSIWFCDFIPWNLNSKNYVQIKNYYPQVIKVKLLFLKRVDSFTDFTINFFWTASLLFIVSVASLFPLFEKVDRIVPCQTESPSHSQFRERSPEVIHSSLIAEVSGLFWCFFCYTNCPSSSLFCIFYFFDQRNTIIVRFVIVLFCES